MYTVRFEYPVNDKLKTAEISFQGVCDLRTFLEVAEAAGFFVFSIHGGL